MSRKILLGAVVALLAVVAVVRFSSPTSAIASSARSLEASLLAPCCFAGLPLDSHDSEAATALRAEIESRVARGESTSAIEADLVERYGAKIRAMPDRGTFANFTLFALAAAVMAGVFVFFRIRRWRQNSDEREHEAATKKGGGAPSTERDEYDDRLDAELRATE